MATQAITSAWTAERPQKRPEYYRGLREEYSSISGNELIAVPSEMEVITTRTISLLKADVNTRKCIAVTRHMMEEALNIGAKVLNRRSNVVWDILLTTEEIAKIEYTGTRKILITLHGVHLYITENHLGESSSLIIDH